MAGRSNCRLVSRSHNRAWAEGPKSDETRQVARRPRCPRCKCQPACKPGSVWRVAPPRRPFLWGRDCSLPRATNPGGGRDQVGCRVAPAPVPPLFGLAPGGVCRAACVAADAVRSYRTFSPLPRGLPRAGGLFSVALSLGSPPAAVSRHRRSLEPGLSSTARFWPQSLAARQRPSGRLARGIRGGRGPWSRGDCRVGHSSWAGNKTGAVTAPV
jgi:hypothetical protein